MSINAFKSWGRLGLGLLLDVTLSTASENVTTNPAVLFFILASHQGTGAGAKLDVYDGSAGNRLFHLESVSGDVSPFGVSLAKGVPFNTGIYVAITATGASVTFGYKEFTG